MDTAESLKKRVLANSGETGISRFLDLCRHHLCDFGHWIPPKTIPHNEIRSFLKSVRVDLASRDLEAMELVRLQDLHCVLHLSESGTLLGLDPDIREEIEEVVTKGLRATTRESEKLAGFFNEFPIPEPLRLASLESPQSSSDEALFFSLKSSASSFFRPWSKPKSRLKEMPRLLASEEPGETLQRWFEKLDEPLSKDSQNPLTISLRLSEDWRVILELKSPEPELPVVHHISLGGVVASPSKSTAGRWLIDLNPVPQKMRKRILEGDLIVDHAMPESDSHAGGVSSD